jgi:hypothetical protein
MDNHHTPKEPELQMEPVHTQKVLIPLQMESIHTQKGLVQLQMDHIHTQKEKHQLQTDNHHTPKELELLLPPPIIHTQKDLVQ